MANEFVKPEYLDKLKEMCLFDDTLMRKAFGESIDATETLLQIIMDNDKIRVQNVIGQYDVTNLLGHSARLDVLAKDEHGRYFNVEVQGENEGATPKRARYYVGIVDTAHFPISTNYKKLFDTYVIFITRNDVLGEGRPIYHIHRHIDESGRYFNDGSHIIYVNGSLCNEKNALGYLMHDFACKNPDDMHYDVLKNRVKHFKETQEGVTTMCKIMDDLKNEGIQQGIQIGMQKTALADIRSLMNNCNWTAKQAMDALSISLEEQKKYLMLL